MPQTLSPGLPVEVGAIDKQLKQLWSQEHGAATRASLINFAVYAEGPGAMESNTALIAEFTREHACRAILIVADPAAPAEGVQAWISAHCHLSRAGAKQVCCEQITFLLEGNSKNLIPNIVFSHLDSDLPLYLWWQADCPDHCDTQLWSWVDWLIFDSQSWPNPKEQFARLRETIIPSNRRMTVCDLNWTRLMPIREALARVFDLPENAAQLARIERVSITYAAGYRSTALLMVSWLITQLGWKLERIAGNEIACEGVRIQLVEAEGFPIGECTLNGPDAEFRIGHDRNLLKSEVHRGAAVNACELMPTDHQEILALLKQELTRGGPRYIYARALAVLERLL